MAALYLSSDFAVPAIPKVSIFLSNTPDLSQAVKVGELTGTVGPQRCTCRVPAGSGVEVGSAVERGTLGRRGAGEAAAAGVKKNLEATLRIVILRSGSPGSPRELIPPVFRPMSNPRKGGGPYV